MRFLHVHVILITTVLKLVISVRNKVCRDSRKGAWVFGGIVKETRLKNFKNPWSEL